MRRVFIIGICLAACKPTPKPKGSTGSSGGSSGGSSTGTLNSGRLTRLDFSGQAVAASADPFDSWIFVDNQLKTNCGFVPVSETDMRCVPGDGFVPHVLYTDPKCQQPVVQVAADGCPAGAYYAESQTAADTQLNIWYGGVSTIVEAGAAVAVPAQLFTLQTFANGECTSTDVDPDATYFAPVSVDTSTFAHATFNRVAGTSGALRRSEIVTDDGQKVHDYFLGEAYDLGLTDNCWFFAGGAMTCTPDADYLQDINTDAHTCHASAIGSGASATTQTLGNYKGNFFDITRAQSSVEAWGQGPVSACDDLGPYDIYTLGAQKTLQSATESFVGTGRIQQDRFTADGLSWMTQYWDSQISSACVDALAADGQVHCVPNAANASARFLDAACSQPIASTYTLVGNTTPANITLPAAACGYQVRIYPVTALATVATQPFMQTPKGKCVPADGVDWAINNTYVTYGAEIPASNFPVIVGD